MKAKKLMSEAEFARHRGVTKQTCNTWKKRGFLVWQDGKIHPEASDAILNSRPQSYRGGRASKLVDAPEPGPVDFTNAASWTTAEACRRKEIALAPTRELAYERARGAVILAEHIQPTWTRIVCGVRSAMLAVPGRLRLSMPHLTPADIEVIRKAITEGLRAAALTDASPPIDGQDHGAAE